jgi:hypothetical protein
MLEVEPRYSRFSFYFNALGSVPDTSSVPRERRSDWIRHGISALW